MKPYRILEEDGEFVTYEFRTIYIYVLYVLVAVMFVGFWTDIRWLSLGGLGLMVLYCATVSLPYLPLHRRIRRAMREDSVEFSGSKWSFARPLRMKLSKDWT